MIAMASKGHFLGQMPHPMQRLSEMKAIFDSGATSMQLGLSAFIKVYVATCSFPVLTTGPGDQWRLSAQSAHLQLFLHSGHAISIIYKPEEMSNLGGISL
jgi:hypothetical protein